jgi:hypothetical protein
LASSRTVLPYRISVLIWSSFSKQGKHFVTQRLMFTSAVRRRGCILCDTNIALWISLIERHLSVWMISPPHVSIVLLLFYFGIKANKTLKFSTPINVLCFHFIVTKTTAAKWGRGQGGVMTSRGAQITIPTWLVLTDMLWKWLGVLPCCPWSLKVFLD